VDHREGLADGSRRLSTNALSRAEKRVGTTLKGKYRLDRVIGVGGMAAVYAATHRNGKEFAVKLLHPVFDDDVAEDGSAFLVMELLFGQTVERRARRRGRSRLDPWATLRASCVHATDFDRDSIRPFGFGHARPKSGSGCSGQIACSHSGDGLSVPCCFGSDANRIAACVAVHRTVEGRRTGVEKELPLGPLLRGRKDAIQRGVRSMRGIQSFVACAALIAFASSASAKGPKARECLDANDQAQALRDQGKLLDAKRKLEVCSARGCPGPVRADCNTWLTEIQAAIPTVVFDIKDTQGQNLSDFRVTVDGKVIAALPSGRALELDPGPHTFTFEATGFAPITQKTVVIEGKKYQSIAGVVGEQPAPPPLVAVPPPPPPPLPENPPATAPVSSTGQVATTVAAPEAVHWPAYLSFGIGAAGIATAGIAGGIAVSYPARPAFARPRA
jgi:hypothetical protein